MKVLVLGGTGAMGIHLVQLLSKGNNEIFVTTRSKRTSDGKIHYIQGNAHEIEFLKTCLKNPWDIIVDFMAYSTLEFAQRVNLLLDVTSHYIFLSSARVYADSDTPIIETSPRLLDVSQDHEFLATDEYSLAKARQEDILINSKYDNWTIIRPYITYSETRLQLGVLEKETWLYRALHHRTIVFSKDIAEKTTTLTYGFDVAQGIATIIGVESVKKQIYHITSDESHTWMEIFNWYLIVFEKQLGYKPKVMIIDDNPRVDINSSKYQVVYDRCYNRNFDNTKIKKLIDTTIFKDTKEGITNCLVTFIRNPQFKINSWSEHAMYDRITGEWTSLSEMKTWKHRIKYLLRRTIIY